MKKDFVLLLLLSLASAAQAASGEDPPRVAVRTGLGTIEIELDVERAPLTAANFLSYVDAGLFRRASFYRVVRLDNDPGNDVKIEVIQGGRSTAAEVTGFAPIEHESTEVTGLRHLDGTVSMARLEPGSASSEFFICVGDQPALDFGGRRNPDGQGFAAFGRVVAGGAIVRQIHRGSHRGHALAPPVQIVDVRRVDPAEGP